MCKELRTNTVMKDGTKLWYISDTGMMGERYRKRYEDKDVDDSGD